MRRWMCDRLPPTWTNPHLPRAFILALHRMIRRRPRNNKPSTTFVLDEPKLNPQQPSSWMNRSEETTPSDSPPKDPHLTLTVCTHTPRTRVFPKPENHQGNNSECSAQNDLSTCHTPAAAHLRHARKPPRDSAMPSRQRNAGLLKFVTSPADSAMPCAVKRCVWEAFRGHRHSAVT